MNAVSKQALLTALNEYGCCDVIVKGESMKPFIRSGDRAIIAAPTSCLRPGMVVAFFNSDQLIMHRITRIKKRTDGSYDCLVHGDSSPKSGGTVHSSRLIGTVLHVYRNGRKHVCWFSSPFRFLVIGIGIVLRFWVQCRYATHRQ